MDKATLDDHWNASTPEKPTKNRGTRVRSKVIPLPLVPSRVPPPRVLYVDKPRPAPKPIEQDLEFGQQLVF